MAELVEHPPSRGLLPEVPSEPQCPARRFQPRFARHSDLRLRWPVAEDWTVFSKRGLAAPLLFFALALAAKGSVDASATLWLCGLAVLWTTAALLPPAETPRLSALGFVVFGYAAWLVITNTFNTYTSAASYDAAFLVRGVLIGLRAGRENIDLLFAVTLAFAVGLAAWSIWQRATGAAPRGRALFDTPATLASILNLV